MIRLMLVALDRSPRATTVFDASVELAGSLGAQLILYQAVVIPADFGPAGMGASDPMPAFLLDEARSQLQALAHLAPHVRCDIRIEASVEPWRSILAAAEIVHADLIVLGSHGYRGWDHIIGTNAARVVNNARQDVMVIHRPDERKGLPA